LNVGFHPLKNDQLRKLEAKQLPQLQLQQLLLLGSTCMTSNHQHRIGPKQDQMQQMTFIESNTEQTTRTYPREGMTPGQPGIPGEMGEVAVEAKRDDVTEAPTAEAAHNQTL
jgi:hypothetical protein